MKTTWPSKIETTTTVCREQLIIAAKQKSNLRENKIGLHFSGIECSLFPEQAADILAGDLSRENEEYLRLVNKYRSLGLEFEGILKTTFFNQLIRKVNVVKDFIFFTEFDEDGMTWANLRNLKNSTLGHNFGRIADEIAELKCDDEDEINGYIKEMRAIDHRMKNLLWPKHSDKMLGVSKRKIKIDLPTAPPRVKDRIIEWRLKGFTLNVMAHIDAILPVIDKYIDGVFESVTYKIKQLKHRSLPTTHLEELKLFLEKSFGEKTIDRDPLLFFSDGQWTIIVDQYGNFAEEREIVATVKNHYNLLGIKYGILTQN